jgi:4-hydroxy-3-polyprenylbenzoate decarboxylase
MIAINLPNFNAAFLAKNAHAYEQSCQCDPQEWVILNVRIRTMIEVVNETDNRDDGATGAPLGVALLQALHEMPEVETHLVMSKWAKTTIELETPWTARDVAALADVTHNPADQAATISSGSFRTDGMIVIPCSMKTLAGIVRAMPKGWSDAPRMWCSKRAASWCWSRVKCRLAPFIWKHAGAFPHGGGDGPPCPLITTIRRTVDDITQHIVTRVLDQFGLEHRKARRWEGLRAAQHFSQEKNMAFDDLKLPAGAG